MRSCNTIDNKKEQVRWDEYIAHEREPKNHGSHILSEMSPELEEELLGQGIFLKQRVRRNMKKLRRQYKREYTRSYIDDDRIYRKHGPLPKTHALKLGS